MKVEETAASWYNRVPHGKSVGIKDAAQILAVSLEYNRLLISECRELRKKLDK